MPVGVRRGVARHIGKFVKSLNGHEIPLASSRGALAGEFSLADLFSPPNTIKKTVRVSFMKRTPTPFYRGQTRGGGENTDPSAPSVPTGLTTTPFSCSQMRVSWNASTDNSGGSGVKGYNLYRNGVYLKQVLAPATTTSDIGLTGSTEYSYTIFAVDDANNASAKSAAVSATTPASACTYALSPSDSLRGLPSAVPLRRESLTGVP